MRTTPSFLSGEPRGDTQGGSPLTGPGGASSPERRLPLTVPGRAVFLGPVPGSEVERLFTYVLSGARHFHVLLSLRPQGARAACLPPLGDSVPGGPALSGAAGGRRRREASLTEGPVLTWSPADVHAPGSRGPACNMSALAFVLLTAGFSLCWCGVR